MANDALTQRQLRAIEALLSTPSLTAAARKAGLATKTIYVYMSNPDFVSELKRRQDELLTLTVARLAGLSDVALEKLADTLEVLAQHAAATMRDFVNVTEGGYTVNLERAEQAGVLHLVKKLWTNKDGKTQIELHDAQSAATSLARLALDILSERRKSAELDDLAARLVEIETLLRLGE